MRKIPVTMATQHPDNALGSPFTGHRFVSTAEEIEECYKCFAELGVHEYMWDWEGKFVDEAVIDRLYQNYTDFFHKEQLGKDLFLTFRIPNIWEEVSHRLPRAFMNVLSAEKAAQTYEFHTPPIFELILPMTTSADQLIHIQDTFSKTIQATSSIFELHSSLKYINLIPLFETIDNMFESKEIMKKYLAFLKDELNVTPEYLRIFIARSDPAMNVGLIPAMIGCKKAIHSFHELAEETGIPVYPWIGAGSLPFRGGVNPDNVDNTINEYEGIHSLTIQSAFRSDYPLKKVKQAIAEYHLRIPKNWADFKGYITDEEFAQLQELNEVCIPYFQKTIEDIAGTINAIAKMLPSHRERVQHVGLFGYSRGVGKVQLPRAIKFTGALYSLGVPPEFIGTGRFLKEAKARGLEALVYKVYRCLKQDLVHAGHYLNKENLRLLGEQNTAWKEIQKDIELTEEFLGEQMGPKQVHHMIHRNFTSNIFYRTSLEEDCSEDVLKAAELRKSLG